MVQRRKATGHAGPTRPEPSLAAVPSYLKLDRTAPIELLSDAQRRHLMRHATVRDFKARAIVYRSGASANSVFIIADGVVKSYRELPSGRRRIAAFLFARDLFGLAEAGLYVNTVQTITPARAYEIEVDALTDLFRLEPDIELQFLCKTVDTLRQAQHHNIIVARRDAMGRFVMLLRLLQKQSEAHARIALPMTKSDIADYLGMTLEAVVRASRRLEREGIAEFVGRHQVRIIDGQRFEAMASSV